MDNECGSAKNDVLDAILLHDIPKTYMQTEHVNKVSIAKERRQIRRKTFMGTSSFLTTQKEREKIFAAVCSRDICAVKDLLSKGARPNVHDEKLRTPLHFAAAGADLCMVKLLLWHKADPNRRDITGNTCLHLAACSCNIPIVTVLLENGADVNSLDGTGKNPMQLAAGRLRYLRRSNRFLGKVMGEVFSVISLMQVYSKKKEMESVVAKLDEISSRLEETALKDDFEAVGNLLDDLTNLNIA